MIYLIITVAIIKIIDLCYLVQIKEYRFDRLWSTMRESGFFNTIYLRTPRFPAKTMRNFLILSIAFLSFLAVLWLYLQLGYSVSISIATLLISPVIALILVVLGVVLTRPLAYALRMQMVARATALMRSRPDIVCIGISGSYGKTSTKEFLYQMLSTKFKVAKTDENKNTDVGVAQSILTNIKPDTQYFIAEVGAYRLGEVAKATKVFMPKLAVITSFGNQHLDLYGSRENLIKAEGEILEFLPANGTAYINKDIPSYHLTAKRTKAAVVSYGLGHSEATISATDIATDPKGNLKARVTYRKKNLELETPILGKHNLSNLLPCIAICIDLGMSVSEVEQALRHLSQVPKKLSLHKGPGNSRILNDSGNSSVDGFLAALDTMKQLNFSNNIIISKGIIELGKEKETSYEMIINTINKIPAQLFTTDKLFTKYGSEDFVHFIASEDMIVQKIMDSLNDNTLVLIEGKCTPALVNRLILI